MQWISTVWRGDRIKSVAGAQLDIAVALSQSASEADRASADAVREEDDVARAKRLSLTPGQASSAAEALSCKLWQTERWGNCHLPALAMPHGLEGRQTCEALE